MKKENQKISDKALQKKIGWTPHPGQKQILESKSDNLVVACGRGFGKSQVASYIGMRELLQDNKQILIAAPTYDLTKMIAEQIIMWINQAFPSLAKGITRNPSFFIKTPWGSTLRCKTADNPVGMLGRRYDLVIVDEAAKLQRRIWEMYIHPATQIKGGRTVYISTPMGLNWFHDLWVRAKETDGAFQFQSKDSPYFTDKDWNRTEQILPQQIFDQEYRARFVSDATSVFRGVDGIISDRCLEDVIDGHRYVMGVDLGRHQDFSVLTVMDKHNNTVCAWDRFKKIDYGFQKKRIIALAQRYNNAKVIIDASNIGDAIATFIQGEGIIVEPYKFHAGKSNSKNALVEKLAIFIEQKKVTIPPNPVLIDELKSFASEVTRQGNMRYNAPRGQHDDSVISLALAVWGLDGRTRKAEHTLKSELAKVHRPKITSYI